jgi:pseudouridine synthase
VATKVGVTIDPHSDRVSLRGRPLRPPREHFYVLFHKPRGYLVTKRDPHGRPTIWKLLGQYEKQVNAVGRLDFDSEGLLLLTNDGEFLHRMTHPRHELWKRYRVKVSGDPSDEALERLRKGIKLTDGKTLPAKVELEKRERGSAWLEIRLREGRKRQIRRMCKAVGHPVVALRRVGVGPIKLGRLKAGEWRKLRNSEVRALVEASKK